MKNAAITLLKIALSLTLLGYLFYQAQQQEGFERLWTDPKDWSMLALAWLVAGGAVTLTLVRWWMLARALGLPLSLRGGLRIGFLGYLFNLAPMGLVGGDLLKAVMLARENRTERTKAVASVAVDRIIGLFMLFIVTTVAIFACGFFNHPIAEVRIVCRITVALTALACAGVLLLITPGITFGRGTEALKRIPRIGPVLESLIEAGRMYRRRPGVLAVAVVMSTCVHLLFAASIYLIALGLPGPKPTLVEHVVIAPLSAVATIVPLPAGPQEGALQYLYGQLAGAWSKGLIVGLAYRIITILIAMVGVFYYLGARSEVAEVMHDAEEERSHDGIVLAAGRQSA